MYILGLQLDAPVQSSAWSLPLKAAYGDIASSKSFVHRRKELAKTVQSKHNNDLFHFEFHLVIDFVLTERKLTHGPVKFPARSISHFAMNIIIWQTDSTAKIISAR